MVKQRGFGRLLTSLTRSFSVMPEGLVVERIDDECAVSVAEEDVSTASM